MTKDLTTSRRAAVDAFLEQNRQVMTAGGGGSGKLVFALDATASREPTWDLARELQAEMFREVTKIGSLNTQLVYFRAAECKSSRWVSHARALADLMMRIDCGTGLTQIEKILKHAREEHTRQRVTALVFIGDCCEEEPAVLYAVAGELAVPCFMFQEGDNPQVTKVFQEIARLTKGAHCSFNSGAADQLRDQLRAAAVYAAGGQRVLAASSNPAAVKLLQQLK